MKGSRKLYIPGLLLLLVFIVGCKKALNRQDYAAYVTDPENGLRKTQQLGEFELSVLYEPAEYILGREFKTAMDDGMDQRRRELELYEHFQFRIKLPEGGNILKYREDQWHHESSRVNHFSFEAAGDFMLVNGIDTLPCKIALYSRNYNLTPTIDLSLTFDKANRDEDLKLIYTDSQFDIGKVKFLFESEDINNTPQLKFE